MKKLITVIILMFFAFIAFADDMNLNIKKFEVKPYNPEQEQNTSDTDNTVQIIGVVIFKDSVDNHKILYVENNKSTLVRYDAGYKYVRHGGGDYEFIHDQIVLQAKAACTSIGKSLSKTKVLVVIDNFDYQFSQGSYGLLVLGSGNATCFFK